jgi:hypothetical protein
VELHPTLIVLAVAVVAAVLFGWVGSRPWDPRRGPRLVPYRFLMLLAGTVAMFMAAHVLSLLGITAPR